MGPRGVKSSRIVPQGSGFPCSQPENARKPGRDKADPCVRGGHWQILHPEPAPSPQTQPRIRAGVMGDIFGHRFATDPDRLSPLPAERGKMDL